MIQDILRNFSLFVDGRGYAGRVDEVSPPKLALKTEEYRAGGMDAPVELDMGMEKLECGFSASGIDAELLKLWGVGPGAPTSLTFRGAVQSEDGSVRSVVVQICGRIRELDWGAWKPGEKAPLKATVACRYYKLRVAGETIHEIDVENMVRIVAGVDQLAGQRAALGI